MMMKIAPNSYSHKEGVQGEEEVRVMMIARNSRACKGGRKDGR